MKNMREWRKERGLTQVQVAEGTGCAPLTVKRWEKGVKPSPAYRRLIAAYRALQDKKGEGKGEIPDGVDLVPGEDSFAVEN